MLKISLVDVQDQLTAASKTSPSSPAPKSPAFPCIATRSARITPDSP